MSSTNIEVSEIQPHLSRAEQEAAVQYVNGHADAAIEILVAALKVKNRTVHVLHANSLVTTLLRLLKVDENAALVGK